MAFKLEWIRNEVVLPFYLALDLNLALVPIPF